MNGCSGLLPRLGQNADGRGKGRAVGGGWSENGGPTSDPPEDDPTGGFYYMDDQLPW
ncbi:hypothetical protein [Paenibacillus polymyxa]|uniref:hypothetical protein n=1 Tax=Paenibacillus polymyxa TaxID=1406 RepID=UPI0032AFFF4D